MCNIEKIYISKRKDYNYCKKDMYQKNENIKINVKEADIYMSQKFSDGFDVSNALSYSRREKMLERYPANRVLKAAARSPF